MSASNEFIVFTGGPGSGKGTQATYIAKTYGLGYISTGELLRDVVKNMLSGGISDAKIDRAQEIATIMQNGGLVPDETVLELMKETIDGSTNRRWILDGYPRNSTQVALLKDTFGTHPKLVVNLVVDDEELVSRLVKRGETSERADDNEETARQRLETYHQQTEEILSVYKSEGVSVQDVDGEHTVERVRKDCIELIKTVWDIQEPSTTTENGQEPKKKSSCCLIF